MSSSFAMITSAYFVSSLMTSGAFFPYFQSFFLKFRSMETVAPAFLAAFMASRAQSAQLWLTAGVMPVTWNQEAPSMIALKS